MDLLGKHFKKRLETECPNSSSFQNRVTGSPIQFEYEGQVGLRKTYPKEVKRNESFITKKFICKCIYAWLMSVESRKFRDSLNNRKKRSKTTVLLIVILQFIERIVVRLSFRVSFSKLCNHSWTDISRFEVVIHLHVLHCLRLSFSSPHFLTYHQKQK